MKKTLTALVLLFMVDMIVAAQTYVFTGPSDLLEKGNAPLGMDFILRQLHVLRRVYCDPETLKRRKKEGVCFLDSKLGDWHQEVSLRTNATVGTVFYSIGYTNWNGRKQIRLIKQNEIIQSIFPRPVGSSTWTNLLNLNLKVDPADILILTPTLG
jgi:hypothetical protein